jgi:hypothetical protein
MIDRNTVQWMMLKIAVFRPLQWFGLAIQSGLIQLSAGCVRGYARVPDVRVRHERKARCNKKTHINRYKYMHIRTKINIIIYLIRQLDRKSREDSSL